MGTLFVVGAIIANSPCYGKNSVGTNEERRDLNYKTLVKQNEQKDGLDIYKTQKLLYSSKLSNVLCANFLYLKKKILLLILCLKLEF